MKKCPACGSTRISENPAYGFRCDKCGYENRKGKQSNVAYR